VSVRAPEKTALWAEPVPSWIVGVRPGDPEAQPEIVNDSNGAPETATAEMCTVAFDGILFNTGELRTAFARSNGTDSNAAILLNGYLREGAKFIERLKGTFSLVVWDGRTGTVLGVRDRMGNYPLFYARTGRELLFSNSIDTLLADARTSSDLNLPLLAHHVVPRWVEEKDETFFLAIRRVVAGNVLRADGTSSTQERYWTPVPEKDAGWISTDEAAERFEETLEDAVRRCLAQGPTALALSGGLDSISIATFAADLANREGYDIPWALSVEFPDPDNTQEALIQKAVAAHLGMPQVMMRLEEALNGRGLLPSALELSAAWPTPLLGIFSPAYFTLIDRAKANGCAAVMTGSGGDNWLSVALEYGTDLMARFDVVGLYRLWNTYQRSYRVKRMLLARRIMWKYGLRNILLSFEHQMILRFRPELMRSQARARVKQKTPPWIAPDPTIRRAIDERAEFVRAQPKPKPGDFYVNEIRRSLDHPLLSVELEEAFEKGRRLGTPVLMPYYDADLVDLLCRTPPTVLNRGQRSKSMVRSMVSRKLAGLGVERQKKITTGNFWPQKTKEAVEAWRTMGGARVLGELGIVDAPRLDQHVQQMLAEERQTFVPYVWEILDHEAWVRARLEPDLGRR
jgi:asparagine synthetase B (glutamine-hydrolysing)